MHCEVTKTEIMTNRQCAKRGWLAAHRPELAVAVDDGEAAKRNGHEFGAFVRSLYPTGKLVAAMSRADAVNETANLRATDPTRVLFEAAFTSNGTLVRADVVEPVEGGLVLREAKAATALESYMLEDAAIQAATIEGAGEAVVRVEVVVVNNKYREGFTPREELAQIIDVTDDVRALMKGADLWTRRTRATLEAANCPTVSMGSHCKKPSACPFADHCRGAVSGFPLTELVGTKDAGIAAAAGVADIRDMNAQKIKNARNQRIHRCIISNQPEITPELIAAMKALPYPRQHLDFETVSHAVPRWPGQTPYQAVPVQFSLHIEPRHGKIKHREYIHTSADSPFETCAAALLGSIEDGGCIVSYGSFEATVIRKLAESAPKYRQELLALVNRIVDLLPMIRAGYYHPAMRGSYSVKKVLPTIPGGKAYSELDGVADGAAAQTALIELIDGTAKEPQRLVRELLAYCKLDTKAMLMLVRYFENALPTARLADAA